MQKTLIKWSHILEIGIIDSKLMLIDLNKKGTIILSHYRSGGTQLRNILLSALSNMKVRHINLGEIEINLNSTDFYSQIYSKFSLGAENEYKVLLLNNPIAISYLNSNDQFKGLLEEYCIFYLERKNKENCLLSLPLWEQFIHRGLYADRDLWTEETMLNFHNELIQTPIKCREIYLGYHNNELHFADEVEQANLTLMYFTQEINTNRYLAKKHNLHTIYYEDYENTPDFISSTYFPTLDTKFITEVLDSNVKIPYVSKQYRDYFDSTTKECLNQWNLNNL